jgi:hypothetical protein
MERYLENGRAAHPSGTDMAGRSPAGSDHPEIKAQRCAATIRNSCSEKAYWEIIEETLRGEDFEKSGLPEQTEALAEIYWPLTISTNYDHLFYCACRKAFEDRLSPTVLGRSAEDCKQVVSALVSPFDREIIWHIQGFLGEMCPQCHPDIVQDEAQLERLRRELACGLLFAGSLESAYRDTGIATPFDSGGLVSVFGRLDPSEPPVEFLLRHELPIPQHRMYLALSMDITFRSAGRLCERSESAAAGTTWLNRQRRAALDA